MRQRVNRNKLDIKAWDDVVIPGIGMGYVLDKAQYGQRNRKETIFSIMLHEEFDKQGSGGYFIKEDWIRSDESGDFFVDIDQVLLDAFNIGVNTH